MANLLLLLLLFFLGNRKLKGKTASNGGVKGSSQRVCMCVHSVIIPSWWVDFPHATLSTNCGKVVNEAPNYPNSTEGSGYLSLTLWCSLSIDPTTGAVMKAVISVSSD